MTVFTIAAPPSAPSSITASDFKLPPPTRTQSLSKGPEAVVDKHDNVAMLHRVSRDFRSDTLTIPTDDMFIVMANASRGDDVYEEDATTTAFEAQIAALTGKEAALFVATGTLSNQLAIRTHLHQPPYSIVCDVRSHINTYESGGAAFHSGAHMIPITPSNKHHLTWEDIEPRLVLAEEEVHSAPTRLICLENTLNGTIFPQEEIVRIANEAHHLGIQMHVDGARLWNVAAETDTPIHTLCKPFDTVNMCFSKGLGAPVGSILAGPAKFIRKARHFRKIFGAGQRQTGPLAAAAKLAVETSLPKLKATHELARYAQAELEKLGVRIITPAETGMLFIDTQSVGIHPAELTERAERLSDPLYVRTQRLVMHFQTDPQAVVDLLQLVAQMKQEKLDQGFVATDNPSAIEGPTGNVYIRAAGDKLPRYMFNNTTRNCT
ncbi:hypothetical protein K437DRAFT_259207 [Tilletiaria anomala UBC 951]|uniref:Aromatic amino acid beta-eliminating lyase/threonine aldolase domain-containing protein n=1 Tax=Tilletiaria anomala (strain ATCC 24038 / CBS 436.72 / UBC 951) TaxID=1037660 RepID=A0A066VK93_TILAU|nr:uncharacterized protein K437DRAFT_259207 [Tilletiaria anomala UBC 951]KDN39005.1 hypothetical protein K437DRAFT_259207 [Tilletiaria anomala UBC 951]